VTIIVKQVSLQMFQADSITGDWGALYCCTEFCRFHDVTNYKLY